MNYNPAISAIPSDEPALRRHLAAADIPTLLMTVAHLTGDLSLLKQAWRPVLVLGVATSGMPPEQEAEVRALCLEKLLALRDAGGPLPARPTYDQLVAMGTWLMGDTIEPYLPLVAEEIASASEDLREPRWNKAQLAPGRDFKVAIVGAGESGLVTALRLKQAGVPFVIYEKNADVGGTWLENHYPGCRVDISSFFYSYAFARRSWDEYYATAEEVLAYLKDVARQAGLYELIRFNSEVTAAAWQEARGVWQLDVRDASGGLRDEANALVFAVGQLNRPMLPNIPGLDSFQGKSFHSARWDHSADWSGKRVGVIGTGASGMQFIPPLARGASRLKVFARTGNWLLPTPNLHDKVSDSTKWLLDELPNYALWYRASVVMPMTVGFLDAVKVDPSYPPTERAVSALNDHVRGQVAQWMESQLADRPDLREALMPDSPIGAKRIVRDNGTWFATLKRDNVQVVRDRIEAVTPKGILCQDGVEHELDLIVYGTGFHASKFLMPIKVTGRGGKDLHAHWQDDARAYLGMTVPGFPNMFCMYGPNTNLVVYSTIIQFSELCANYIVDAARLLLEGKHKSLDVKQDVFDSFNARIDEANSQRAWGYSTVNSWYKNSKGRVTQNYPFNAAEFWKRTHEVLATDYHIE